MTNFIKNSLILSLIFLYGATVCFAQFDPKDSNNLFLKKGKILVEETVGSAIGDLEVSGYRLELVELPESFEMPQKAPLTKAFRLVVTTAKPLPFSDYSIWMDYHQKDAYLTKPNEVAIIIYAETLPDDMITLGFSTRENADYEKRLVLPNPLSVPADYAASLSAMAANAPIIKIKRVTDIRGSKVELRMITPSKECAVTNSGWIFEIGGRKFVSNCYGDLVIEMSSEDFSQLRDGADIIVKIYSGGRPKVWGVAGKLNKSSIEN